MGEAAYAVGGANAPTAKTNLSANNPKLPHVHPPLPNVEYWKRERVLVDQCQSEATAYECTITAHLLIGSVIGIDMKYMNRCTRLYREIFFS
jgi:hypothetical protein